MTPSMILSRFNLLVYFYIIKKIEIDDLNRKIENLFQGNCVSENGSKENINLPTTIKSILSNFEVDG